MILVFLVFMVIGITLVTDGLYTKEAKSINNGIVLILIMLVSIIYSITTL